MRGRWERALEMAKMGVSGSENNKKLHLIKKKNQTPRCW